MGFVPNPRLFEAADEDCERNPPSRPTLCLEGSYYPFIRTFLHEGKMEAKPEGTDVSGAVFDGADLRGADLTGVTGLTVEQLWSAKVDETTRFPAHLQPAADTP